MQRHVPQEITALIIDILGEDLLDSQENGCRPALANCLFVSRAFCHHARRNLFRSVRLQNNPQETFFDRVAALREIMAPRSNSKLGMISYIKVFSVEIFSNPKTTLYRKQDSGLALILKAFLRFKSGLEAFGFWGCDVEWPQLGKTVQKLFRSILRSPSLSTIHLSGLEDVPRSILTGVKCKNLHIWRLRMDSRADERTPSEFANTAQLQLENFDTDHSFPLKYVSSSGPRMVPHISTSPFLYLKKLALEFELEQYFQEAIILLSEAKLSLQELEIVLHSYRPIPAIAIDQFPELQALDLEYCTSASSFQTPVSDNFPDIDVIPILDTSTPCVSLKHLNLRFRTYYIANSRIHLSEAPIWFNIDTLLSKPHFASLTRVGIFVTMDMSTSHRSARARAEFIASAVPQLREAFPLLSGSDSIEFTVEIGGRCQ